MVKKVVKGAMRTSQLIRLNHKVLNHGISLLELSLVIFLVAILLGFSLPRFTTLFQSDLELETKKIAKIIKDLRIQAILQEKKFHMVFDTKKSTYTVLEQSSRNRRKFVQSKLFKKPLKLKAPVEFYQISNEVSSQNTPQFGGPPIIFEKIFGQEFRFSIDSSGFVDPFTVRLKDKTHYQSLSVYDIMGNIRISEKESL